MSRKIYGVTVGTTISPKFLEKKLKPVKTVNGTEPDENGNVQVGGSAEAVQANLDAHTGNKKNPHGVTAAQVGARPDTWMPSASDVHARPDNWMPSASDVGAAPAGYGYGGTLPTLRTKTDADGTEFVGMLNALLATMGDLEAKQIVWQNSPFLDGKWRRGTLLKITEGYAVLDGFTYNGRDVRKLLDNGVWTPFEWYNPPMIPSEEYRTTERWNNEVKYKKLVNLGTMPNATIKYVQTEIDGTKYRIVDSSLRLYTSSGYTRTNTQDNFDFNFGFETGTIDYSVCVSTTLNYSDMSGEVLISYVEK